MFAGRGLSKRYSSFAGTKWPGGTKLGRKAVTLDIEGRHGFLPVTSQRYLKRGRQTKEQRLDEIRLT